MNIKLFDPFFKEKGFLLLDGALATELQARGNDMDHPLWSAKILLENPNSIKKLHLDYLEAGADCIITSSYQATFQGLEKEGYSKTQAKNIFDLSVQLALDARKEFMVNHPMRPKPLIAASIGPYGAYLNDGSEYQGHYSLSDKDLYEFHKKRFLTLADSKADLLAFETIPCLQEAKVYLQLLRMKPNRKAWMSFSCKDERHISNGDLIKKAAQFFQNQEAVFALGINCTKPQYILSLISEIKPHFKKEIVVYPNSGEDWSLIEKKWRLTDQKFNAKEFSEASRDWLQAGARLIGGCCRTNPETIRTILERFKKFPV